MARVTIQKLGSTHVMLAGIERLRIDDPDEFIRSLRTAAKKAAVQAVDATFVAGREHILEVARQSLRARKAGTMLSKRIEVDLILRVACTNQISRALDDVGIRKGLNGVLVVAIGNKRDLLSLQRHLANNYRLNAKMLELSRKKERKLAAHHGISRTELSAVMDDSKMAGLLAERANLLW